MCPGPLFADNVADGSLRVERYAAASVEETGALPVSRAWSASDSAPVVKDLASKPSSRSKFNMSHVERIRIRVWGNSDLTGEYAIDPDNSLSVPRVGRIEVGEMSPADLEQLLAQKLSAMMRNETTVAIEVAKFRPYFIMGQVAQAGEIEWRPGLKVIQAISLARGVLRPSGGAADPVNSNRQYKTQLTFALAQLARLKAEQKGVETVATTDRVASLIKSVPDTSRLALTSLISRQNDMLREQREIMDTRLVGLQREREAAQRELEAAQAQEQTVSQHLEITRTQLASIEALRKKQLVTNARYYDQKSNLLLIEVRYAEAHALVERARTRLNTVEQQIAMLPQQRRADLNERIDTLEREVAQLELAAGISANEEESHGDVLKLTYHIARESASGVQTVPATVFTEILPGDVLIVGNGQEGVAAATGGETRTSGAKEASAVDHAQRLIEQAAITAPSSGYLTGAAAELEDFSAR